MKARLFVVDERTRASTIELNEVSVLVPDPQGKMQWNKTFMDIISDLLQIEIGDYIFLWEKKAKNIYGVYRAVSKPFYQSAEEGNGIFRVKIQVAYDFRQPIREYDIINNPYMKNQLWNIIGKKVAGKSRGTSPITDEEAQFLIQALINCNSEYEYIDNYSEVIVSEELELDFCNEYQEMKLESLQEYSHRPIRFRVKNEVNYEKALEVILNYLFREKEERIIANLGIDVRNVKWYANYLPYGLERSEIDYMVMESEDGQNITRFSVIELMKSVIDVDHIDRCLQYGKWVREAIANGNKIVRPILICGCKSVVAGNGLPNVQIKDAIQKLPIKYGFDEIEIYTYELDGVSIIFSKV